MGIEPKPIVCHPVPSCSWPVKVRSRGQVVISERVTITACHSLLTFLLFALRDNVLDTVRRQKRVK